MFQQLGKWMLIVGLAVAGVGAVLYALGRLGVVRLPGDLSFGGRNWRVWLPLGTCVALSIVLTLVMWVLVRLRR